MKVQKILLLAGTALLISGFATDGYAKGPKGEHGGGKPMMAESHGGSKASMPEAAADKVAADTDDAAVDEEEKEGFTKKIKDFFSKKEDEDNDRDHGKKEKHEKGEHAEKGKKGEHGAQILSHEKTEDGVKQEILMPDGSVKEVGSAYAGEGKGEHDDEHDGEHGGHHGKHGDTADTSATDEVMKDAKEKAKETLDDMGVDSDTVEEVTKTIIENTTGGQ